MLNQKRQRNNSSFTNNQYYRKLPIDEYKEVILEKIKTNRVTIISGETGCGKSTQIPQIIIENFPDKKIIMTQPRRIAAISLQKRIKKELEKKNYNRKLVGYQVGMDKEIYNNTQIFIKTTGVFLEECIHEDDLNYDCIIIDEVHERDVNIDLVLIMVKKLLEKKDNIKVILMSATINIQTFSNYFYKYGNYNNLVLEVKEKIHKIKEYYIEDIEENLKDYHIYMKNFNENKGEPYFNEDLFEYVKYIIIEIYKKSNEEESILIFIPGLYEIKSLENYLNKQFEESHLNIKNNTEILILHSELKELQKKVFENIKGKRKIILSTNIAESSITIPNITYVIDFCLTKENQFDSINQNDLLKLNWCSKANLKQRSGRTGRTNNGFVFRLIHKEFYDKLSETPKPEILRTSLDKVILKIKVYSNEEPHKILKGLIDCPKEDEIFKSIKKLKLLGALSMTNNEYLSGNLTDLGKIYAELPIDIQYSRLIILTSFFDLIDAGIVVSSICSQEKKMFSVKNLKNKYDLYQIKKESEFYQNQDCDFIICYNIYWKWKKLFGTKMQHDEFDVYFEEKKSVEQDNFIKKYGLNFRVLIEILKTESDLKNRLRRFGKFYKTKNQIDFSNRDNSFFFKIALMGAFYQNLIYAYFQNDKIYNRIYSEENRDKLKKSIEIKNIDKADLKKVEKCINNIIYPDKILEITDYNGSFSITLGNIDSIVKLYYISNNDKLTLMIDEKYYQFKLSKYEFKVNLKLASTKENIIVDNESINYIVLETDNKVLQKYRFVSNKCIQKNYNKLQCTYLSKLPDIKMFDELSIIIFSPDLIFEGDEHNKVYKSFKLKGIENNNIDFSCYFGTGDLIKINKIRNILNKLTQLPLFIVKDENNKDIEEVNLEYKKLQEQVFKEIKLLFKDRIEIIKNKDRYEELFKKFFKDFIVIDDFKSKFSLIEQCKNVQFSPKDFLKPLKPIENLNEDFRSSTEEGKRNILEQKSKFHELIHLLEKEFELAKIIARGDYYINLHCKYCDDYICSANELIDLNNNKNEKKIYFRNWRCENIKIFEPEESICKESNFVQKCFQENYMIDNFISCKNNHIFGGKYLENFFITSFSNLCLKYYDGIKEDFNYKFVENNFQFLKEKIIEMKEKLNKKKNETFYCELCNEYCDNVKDFVKHLKDNSHKSYFDDLKVDLE